jgi:hypothetical protein
MKFSIPNLNYVYKLKMTLTSLISTRLEKYTLHGHLLINFIKLGTFVIFRDQQRKMFGLQECK